MFFPDIKKNDIWQIGHNKLAKIKSDGDKISLKNIRNIDHHYKKEIYFDSDFIVQDLEDIYLLSVPFGYKNLLSHLMLEFSFSNNKKIILSVEARRQPGEGFSSLKGLFRHFGLIYVWGTFEDLVGLRAYIRKDKVYRYKLVLSKAEKVKGLNYFSRRTNSLIKKPEYYNTFTNNCTTNLWDAFSLKKVNKPSFSSKVFFSGLIDKYLYDLGYLENDLDFESLKNNSLIIR